MIIQYRTDKQNINPSIGCIVLTNPVFFTKEDWIDVSAYWSPGIVQGKSFDTETTVGKSLWERISSVLRKYESQQLANQAPEEGSLLDTEWPGYNPLAFKKVRVGQGAFRVLVTDAYQRRCSISGEKTLPVLEAAHIKPYNLEGPHRVSNGLLLRSDLHKLFDNGYITITKEFRVEVSKAIREEFENGKEYYRFHGNELLYLPSNVADRPNEGFIEWHNSIYKG
jgi:putative restriction endonuclease